MIGAEGGGKPTAFLYGREGGRKIEPNERLALSEKRKKRKVGGKISVPRGGGGRKRKRGGKTLPQKR